MVPVDIPTEHLAEGIKGLKVLGNFEGAAVTIPHKLNLAVFCDELGQGQKQRLRLTLSALQMTVICWAIILTVMVSLLVFWVKILLVYYLNKSLKINQY